MELTAGDLAARLGGTCRGETARPVRGVGSLLDARDDQVLYASGRKNFAVAAAGGAGTILAKTAFGDTDKTLVLVEDPKAAYVACLRLFEAPEAVAAGVHPAAYVAPTARLGAGVALMPHASVMDGAEVGPGTVLWPGAYVGPGARVGADCRIHANAVIEKGCVLGDRVVLWGGAVVGSDGFSYETGADGRHAKIPQVGIVVVGDDVEIGANACVDRATAGVTLVGRGTKIDNLVQVAHNVRLGEDGILCSQTGIAGSTVTGRSCVFGGQVGVADHAVIGDRVTVGAKSGVSTRALEPGKTYFGIPAREIGEAKRIVAALALLPGKLGALGRLPGGDPETTESE